MVKFTDERKRIIDIEIGDCSAEAYHKGDRIGDISTTGLQEIDSRMPPYPAKVTGMFVNERYQRAGIAIEMLRLLSDDLGTLVPADKNVGRGNENTLTNEGLALTEAAQKRGYIFPFSEESV